ncbi:Chaperone protein dnaJ 2 [Camellia lanceoleosa]|uniref:Chaperone protein dnaJ 2 n=1 Tax=Camellia lanceoleosa TaxID=1840588 RepID=A0ACC0F280_9ERIC|nr:Chaperone protein dnaJ 2 [Camellia lanceoleosa]
MPLYGRIPKLKGIVGGGNSSRGRKQQGEVISDRDRCLQCKGNEVKAEKKVLKVHVEKGMQHAQKISFSGETDEAPLSRLLFVSSNLVFGQENAWSFCHHRMTSISTTNSPTARSYSDHWFFRYGYNRHCWSEDEKGMKNNFTRTQIGAHKKRRLSFSPQACSALVTTRNSSLTNFCQENIDKIPYVNCPVLIIHVIMGPLDVKEHEVVILEGDGLHGFGVWGMVGADGDNVSRGSARKRIGQASGNANVPQEGCSSRPLVRSSIVLNTSHVAYIPMVTNHAEHDNGVDVGENDGSDLVVVSPSMKDGCQESNGMNSFVRKIKGNVRKNLKFPGFEYPEMRVRTQKVDSKLSSTRKNGERGNVGGLVCGDVIDIETIGLEKKVGQNDDNTVYFFNVRALVRQLGVRGNVIDAFAKVLSDKQNRLNTGKDFPKNSYFFRSICWDVMKSDNVDARSNYVTSNLHSGRDARYIYFSICHLGHWTLMVYDTENRSWKHYDSMQNQSSTGSAHYAKAIKLVS